MKVNFLTCHTTWRMVLVTTGLTWSSLLLAESVQPESHEAIRAVATEFARQQIDDSALQNIQVTASQLDPRLNLASCDKPLEAFPTGNSRQLARTTVGVRCTGKKPWTLYVPVTIDALANVVVTSRPLLRGEVLAPETLEVRQVPLARLPLNHLSEVAQLTGMETSRPLQAGVAITLNAVKPRELIKQGQEVTIVANSGSIRVRMSGVAIRSGSRGELIPIRNHSSGRTVEAEILDANTVRVNF